MLQSALRQEHSEETIEDTLKNLKEATELYLEEFPLKNERSLL